VHLPPLPGAPGPRISMEAIVEQAADEAGLLIGAGFDAVMVENYGDLPFYPDTVPPETVAAMAIVVGYVVRAIQRPVGVNVLRNDARAALAVAATAGAAFIRINVHSGVVATDQGVLTGQAARTVRQPDLAHAAADTAYRGMADGLIVSGQATGQPTSIEDVRVVKRAVPDRPVW